MDISSLTNISSDYIRQAYDSGRAAQTNETGKKEDFASVLDAAMNMVNETNDLQNKAESEEIRFLLGESTSTHELAAAQQKANIALQYTVAVRNKMLDAYKEIMNMQI